MRALTSNLLISCSRPLYESFVAPLFAKKTPAMGIFLSVLFFLITAYPRRLSKFRSVAFFDTFPETTNENLFSWVPGVGMNLKEKYSEDTVLPPLSTRGNNSVLTFLFWGSMRSWWFSIL